MATFEILDIIIIWPKMGTTKVGLNPSFLAQQVFYSQPHVLGHFWAHPWAQPSACDEIGQRRDGCLKKQLDTFDLDM